MKKILIFILFTCFSFGQTPYEYCKKKIEFTEGIEHFGDYIRHNLVGLTQTDINYTITMLIDEEGQIYDVDVSPFNSEIGHLFSIIFREYVYIAPAEDKKHNKISSSFTFNMVL